MKHLPNILTLSRIPMLFIIVTLLCFPVKFGDTVALVLFLAAAISDWLDGYIARKVGAVSNFGKLMDALTDKIIMVGLFVALLSLRWKLPDAYGNAPSELETLLPQYCVLLVMVIICREFLITGLRLVAASNGLVLAAERAGKIKTALQMVSMSLLLLAYALSTDWAQLVPQAVTAWARELGLWTFYAAVALTIYSGSGYLVRNRKIFLGDAVQ